MAALKMRFLKPQVHAAHVSLDFFAMFDYY